MKPVGSEYMEQYNALLRYVFQVTEQELSSIGWQEREIIRAKFPTMEKADVIGWFDNDTLVSQVAVYPMHVRIFGQTYAMGGLTGVGTYPEYSNMGLMHKLLEQALKNMKERGQDICYLYPYSIPYYRRKGWEIISDKISYEIKDYQLPKNHQVPGDVRRVDTEGEELKETYKRYAMRTHGAILRDDLAWNEYWLWDSDDIMAAVYYNEKNEPDGYVIYWIAKEVFHIKDMIFNNEEARTGLWNFVAAHFSMINQVEGDTYTDEPLAFLLEDASIKEVISPSCKVPHIGWNVLLFPKERPRSRLFRYLEEKEYVYFVHSYYAANCDSFVSAYTDYTAPLTAAAENGNIFGTQFHPEKSGDAGLRILKAFCEI